MNTQTDKSSYLIHLVGFAIVLFALSDVLQSRELIIAGAALSAFAFILCIPNNDGYRVMQSIFFIILLLITSLVNLFFTSNGLGGTIILFGNLLLAYLYILTLDKKLTIWILLAYTITIVFISYNLFILNVGANNIYDGLSRNHAGFVVIFWTGFLLFHLKINYNSTFLIFPIFGLALCFFLLGRTSLIVSALLVLLVLLHKLRRNKISQIIAVAVLSVSGYYLFILFGELLETQTNLGSGLDTIRWELWRIYWEHINLTNIFTGVDVSTLPKYDLIGGNPHNSFIKFHSRTGVGSVVFIILLFVSIYKYLHAKKYFILGILLLLTLRAFFDSDLLIGSFDFIFLIITFYWIKTDEYEPRYLDNHRSL